MHAFVLHVFACLTSIIQWYMSMFEEEIIADHPHYRYRNWKLKSQATATCPQVFGTSIEFWLLPSVLDSLWGTYRMMSRCWFNRFSQNWCQKSTRFRKHFFVLPSKIASCSFTSLFGRHGQWAMQVLEGWWCRPRSKGYRTACGWRC